MATHNEVAHAWAHQTGKQRRGFNMYYEGDTIYSYGRHFPIARIVSIGGPVLFTTKSYSISTSKHKSYVWRAVHHRVTFHVPNVEASTTAAHLDNFGSYIERAKAAIDKAKRARKYKDAHLNDAAHLVAEANRYSEAFELAQPPLTLDDIDAAAAELKRAAEAEEARWREERERTARERQRERRTELKPLLRDWLMGQPVRPPHTERPLVRVHGTVVETTWGASVPLAEALKLFRLAAKVRKTGREWHPEGLRALKAGDFAVNRIGPTGNMVVGCHNIPFRFAKVAANLAGISIEGEDLVIRS